MALFAKKVAKLLYSSLATRGLFILRGIFSKFEKF